MKAVVFVVVCTLCFWQLPAQFNNNIWCFGDSAGIDWTDPQNPIPFTSSVMNRGASVSIKNSLTGALIYSCSRSGLAGNTTKIWNKYHLPITNGDNIFGEGWYHELVLLPFPDADSLLLLFSIGVTGGISPFGMKYSLINYMAKNDSGIVLQKNVFLNSMPAVDALSAIKHGNGRNWWLVFQRWDNAGFTSNNEFHIFEVTPTGINVMPIQYVGNLHSSNGGCLRFNREGNQFVNLNFKGFIELYDFDRCTGLVSNPVNVRLEDVGPNFVNSYSSAEFSSNGNYLYVSKISIQANSFSYLEQYDLTSPSIPNSVITIDSFFTDTVQINDLKMAPDSNIYLTSMYTGFGATYPYHDTLYHTFNNNLSTIQNPNNSGLSCNFQPFILNLGTGKSYYSLPNNPDYELGPLIGSPCDTLTSVEEIKNEINFHSWFHPDWEILFVNADKLKGSNCVINVYDLSGRLIKTQNGKPYSGYFTADVALPGLSSGVYIVQLVTEKESVSGKFFKN